MNFKRMGVYLGSALLLLWTTCKILDPLNEAPPSGASAAKGAGAGAAPGNDELADLRLKLAERDREIAQLRAAVGVNGPNRAGEQGRPNTTAGNLSHSDESPSLQVEQFQFEQQRGRVLVKDANGDPAFVFDTERRSILAPKGVYIPAEGRLVLADAPPESAKSRLAIEPVVVGFKNETAFRMDMAWVDYKGKLVHYKTLQPGESYEQRTFETHTWVTMDSAGRILDVIHPTKQDQNSEFIFEPKADRPAQ